ncbi:MAG: NADP-dependent phosphogluconate dehydrogenase [Proteobacteria bacterium]|nr:NADP-dependent phosphogluconate dehydrogenase [Pseudomonadota bacterium]
MGTHSCEIGVIGLGVMGRNLALNCAEHGFPVVVYNRTAEKTSEFIVRDAAGVALRAGYTLQEFTELLRKPRAVIMMVPAGPPVDSMIQELLLFLEAGDVLIDGGNSRPVDTDRRGKSLQEKGILYLGTGISGGEAGARFGPSIMPGGPQKAYERVQPVMEAIAARAEGAPCVSYLGQGSAGHYVKMVHNGIEYGLMQLIAETYDVMKRGLGLQAGELHHIYAQWNEGKTACYLLEITARIFSALDEKTGQPLINLILDAAGQKGSGMWTSQEALNLQIPTPTIDASVAMRNLSGLKKDRTAAAGVLGLAAPAFSGDRRRFIEQLRGAFYAGMLLTYTQGFALLYRASQVNTYRLRLAEVARIWRGGCIIRASLLNGIGTACRINPDLSNLLMDEQIAQALITHCDDLRAVVQSAAAMGIPAPAFMASLSYLDSYRSPWLPANLIQAQRDCFGAHTYERLDMPGTFHSKWQKDRD